MTSRHTSTRIAEKVAAFAGSLTFLYLNTLCFAVWIALNVWSPWKFDAWPFAGLTLAVSLEAIGLTVFVLIAQNRQAEQDRVLAEKDRQTNQEAEREIREMMTHLHEQDQQIATLTQQLQSKQETDR